jgi:hypothetical protein
MILAEISTIISKDQQMQVEIKETDHQRLTSNQH